MTDEKILEIYRDHGFDTEYIETDVIAFARLIQAEQREADSKICDSHCEVPCNSAEVIRGIRK